MQPRATLTFLLPIALVALALPARAQAVEGEPPPVSAPSVGQITLAETLYREGRQLMAEQRYSEAAAKFDESYRLDPATGTLLNLAACREAEGKLASAWLAFTDAMRAARREQRDDRVKFAEEHIAAIEPRLSRLTIEVRPHARATDLVVRLDGLAIGPAAYGVPNPIDPGPHRIDVAAAGKKPWSIEVMVGKEADRQAVVIPLLEDAEAPGPVAPGPINPAPAPPPGDPGAAAHERPIPSSVYVAGATTSVLAAASIVTSILYLGARHEYNSASREDRTTAQQDRAERMGVINAVLWGASAVGAGVTVYLYTSRPEAQGTRVLAPRVATWLAPGAGGLELASEF